MCIMLLARAATTRRLSFVNVCGVLVPMCRLLSLFALLLAPCALAVPQPASHAVTAGDVRADAKKAFDFALKNITTTYQWYARGFSYSCGRHLASDCASMETLGPVLPSMCGARSSCRC